MAKLCVGCGKEISDGLAFCTECGTKAPEGEVSAPRAEAEAGQRQAEAVSAAQTCLSCGSQLEDGVSFCSECGIPRNGDPVQEPPKAANSAPAQQPQVACTPPIQQPGCRQISAQEQPPKGGKYGVIGTGTFFGLEFLFMLPLIGWIACLIMAFAPKNVNLKHYARAKLIWVLISVVLCIAAYFLIQWIGSVFIDYINRVTDGMFTEWSDLFEQFKQFENGGLEDLPLK